MNSEEKILTSESVCPGHPDKICDQISDALVDLYLRQDPASRLAIETVVSTQRVIILGEVSSSAQISAQEREETVRHVIQKIGYEHKGFHWQTCFIEELLHAQSPDIAQGVVTGGAGDQGFMYGYACDETPALMPAPLYYAHHLLKALEEAQIAGQFPGLLPDGKAQLCVRYQQNKPIGLSRIVLSKQHQEEFSLQDLRSSLQAWLPTVFPTGWMCPEDHIYINPTGRFVIGGPAGDTGLTGRKIIVDSYGGAAPHGGGAFSGKDGTKVDRSAAYMMRYLAKNVVAAGLAKKCTLQVSYSIGRAEPLSFYLTTHGTGHLSDQQLAVRLYELVDLTPQGIIKTLNLHQPHYQRTATFGHFGQIPTLEGHFAWEKTDLAALLTKEVA